MKRHLKRVNAPKTWKLLRKTNKFIRRPNPGAHTFNLGTSIMTLLKEVELLAGSSREIRMILNKQEVLVNGKRVKNPDRLVGLMDIVTIPAINFVKQVTISDKGYLILKEIAAKDAHNRQLKIINKSQFKGNIQYNCLDGTNIISKKNEYAIGDTLVVANKDGKVISFSPLKKGANVLIHAGNKIGTLAKVHDITGDIISLDKDGKTFETKKKYAFVLP